MEKVFITKYALTKGIMECELIKVHGNFGASIFDKNGFNKESFIQNGDWHKDLNSAISAAEEMRIKKLQALDRQIKKLSAKKFD